MAIPISEDSRSWIAFEALVAETHDLGQTNDFLRKRIRLHIAEHGWSDWWPTGAKGYELRLAHLIKRVYSRRRYMDFRRAQLLDGDYKFWVIRVDGHFNPENKDADGVALSADDPFFGEWFPPNGFRCHWDIEGAQTENGIRRMGGDPAKRLPERYSSTTPPELFRGLRSASIRETLEAVLDGSAPVWEPGAVR